MEVTGRQMMEDFFTGRRDTILKKWAERIFASYPAGSITFLKNNLDPFNNPVGNTIVEETAVLFDQLNGAMAEETVLPSLERIIKIRAVQEFSPSEAVSFVFLLKDILLHELSKHRSDEANQDRLMEIFSNIDRMALMAFDIHADCRERISRIRLEEAKMSAFMRRERLIRKDATDKDNEK